MKKIFILLLVVGGLYLLRPTFQDFLIIFSHQVQNTISLPSQGLNLEEELKILRVEVEKLRQENKRLRELLNLSSRYVNSIPAEIVFRIKEELTDRIIINAGRNKNVIPHSAVVTKYGLLGIVDNVRRRFSTVLPVYDPRFQISARVSSTREVALLKGQGRGNNLVLTYLNLNTEAKNGDLVFTSGEGILPKGIPVGEIKTISVHPSQVYKVAEVKPLVNFNKVEEVVILCKELK